VTVVAVTVVEAAIEMRGSAASGTAG
jgi:hypothetical protein